jgi:ribosomal protein S18 acetylase RimI-like enzyme
MSELRELRDEDADAVAELFVAAFGESRRMDGGEIREWLRNEALQAENLQVLVEGGTVVGYGDIWMSAGTIDLDAAAPGRWAEIFGWAEERARAEGVQRVRSFFVEGHELEDFVTARGYRPIRASYTMEIELAEDAPAGPAAIEGIEIRPYRHPDDEGRTYEAQEESFEDHWDHNPQPIETWREFSVKQTNFDPSLWFLALAGDEVAGLSLNFPERSGDPGYGWVGTLGVRRAWRRRGIGEALLRHSFRALHERGQRRVRLSVDAESLTGATRLYERAGMRVIRQANTWELDLAP